MKSILLICLWLSRVLEFCHLYRYWCINKQVTSCLWTPCQLAWQCSAWQPVSMMLLLSLMGGDGLRASQICKYGARPTNASTASVTWLHAFRILHLIPVGPCLLLESWSLVWWANAPLPQVVSDKGNQRWNTRRVRMEDERYVDARKIVSSRERENWIIKWTFHRECAWHCT